MFFLILVGAIEGDEVKFASSCHIYQLIVLIYFSSTSSFGRVFVISDNLYLNIFLYHISMERL